jgi:Family of unknown function (DUF5670)
LTVTPCSHRLWPGRINNRASLADGFAGRGYNLSSDKRSGTASHEARYDLTERKPMLWTIFVILLILWLLGLVSSYTLGGFIHLLLVLAIIVLIINLIQGRRPL